MIAKYLSDGKIDLRTLKHDLRGLLTPLSTALKCMKSGEVDDGLMLQEEVLKKLESIVEQLDKSPNEADVTEEK